jgi:WD40 repeat protein
VKSIFTNGSDFDVSIAFSHDGNGLAVGGLRSPVRFWDVRDGRLLFTFTNYNQPRIACSPAGPFMAVGTEGDWWGQRGGNVYLVDLNSGKEVRMLPGAGDRAVFSRDGKRLATANGGSFQTSQSVILWDVASGKKLHVLADKRQVLRMAFSPEGRLLAIGTRHGDVTLWDLNDFSHSTLRQATGDYARSLAFSPDGRSLAVAMLTQEVEIWDVQERRLSERLHGHTWEVNAVAYSPDGSQLASGCQDGTIRFWNPQPSTVQKVMPEYQWGQNRKVEYPVFSPDSRWMAAAMRNGDLQIVDTATADWSVRTVLTNAGVPVTFSRDPSTLLTLTGEAKTLRRWNLASKALLSTTRLSTTNVAWGFSSITPDGNFLALANSRLIEIFETRTGRRVDPLERGGIIDSIGLSPDGQFLAIGTGNSGLLWDIAAHRFIWTAKGHRSRIHTIRFSADQKMIVTGSWDSSVRLWDVATGKELALLTGHKAAVLNCAFAPDGRTLATKSDDRTIKFWNLATLREVASIALDYTGNIQGQLSRLFSGRPDPDRQ